MFVLHYDLLHMHICIWFQVSHISLIIYVSIIIFKKITPLTFTKKLELI